jgi:hypothetical protein
VFPTKYHYWAIPPNSESRIMIMDLKFGSNCDQSASPPIHWPLGDMAAIFVGASLVIAATTAIAARAAIVSIAPATAAVYAGVGLPVNLRGLSIAGVHVTVSQQTDGPGDLLVTGEIENLRDTQTSVPNLRLALRGEDGRELYGWTARAPKLSLHPRERVPFRARLAAPPAGVRDVLVKFAAPGDNGLFTEAPS